MNTSADVAHDPIPIDIATRRWLVRIGLTTAIATAIAIGVVVAGGGGGAVATANLWVIASDTPNGTCTRSAGLETKDVAIAAGRQCNPNDDTTNGVFMAAYNSSTTSGDTVCVAAGSYGAQQVTYIASKTTPNTVIKGCEATQPTVLSLTVGQGNGSTQTCCVTFQDMAITGSASNRAVFIYYGSNGANKLADRADHITFDNVDVCVGQATNGPCFEAFSTDTVTVKNSTFGPACCGNNGSGVETGSPVGIRFGADTASSFPFNTDTVIHNNLIQFITRLCTEWPTSGYGSCPSTTCVNAGDLCHEDGMQIWGANNLTITNNKIYHTGISGIFLDSTATFTDGLIQNNMIGDIMRGAPCLDIDGRGILGTWNVINNTCSVAGTDGFYVAHATTMDTNNAVWNWKGNIGALFISATTTPSGDCVAGTTGVFSYSYNTFSTNNGGATGCGGNTTVGDPGYADTALDPANTMDLHLAGAASFADNKIVPPVFVATDIDGQSRPIDSNGDAGADER